MNNIGKAIKLDVLSVMPYMTVKNLVVLVALGSFYVLLLKTPIMSVVMTQIFSLMFATYPFMVGDQAGIDPLFKIMGIKSDDVVSGRYLLAFLLIVSMLIVGIVMAALGSILYPSENLTSTLLSSAATMFIVSSLVVFIQYPIFFKMGYLKARTIGMMPFFLIGIAIFAAGRLSFKLQNLVAYVMQHKYIFIFALLAFWCLAFFVSIVLAKKFYRQRDF
ncbi:MAG: ABC-2 transporter permease [Clostridiales bacterium]|nr:ABC-2 transporter permease [Clostridiales bacterium]